MRGDSDISTWKDVINHNRLIKASWKGRTSKED